MRGEREITELAGTLETQEMNEIADADNMPLAICTSMSLAINAVKVSPQQSVNALLWWSLDDKINAISQVITDCERLVRTPVPLAYSVHTSRLLPAEGPDPLAPLPPWLRCNSRNLADACSFATSWESSPLCARFAARRACECVR